MPRGIRIQGPSISTLQKKLSVHRRILASLLLANPIAYEYVEGARRLAEVCGDFDAAAELDALPMLIWQQSGGESASQ